MYFHMIDSIRVQNFKSIVDSGWVQTDQSITTFVGGNEAGKSNFFESISLLGDPKEINNSFLCDYNPDSWESIEKSKILL